MRRWRGCSHARSSEGLSSLESLQISADPQEALVAHANKHALMKKIEPQADAA